MSLPTARSARCSSRSGFTPGNTRRNSLRMDCSPQDTEVLRLLDPEHPANRAIGDLRPGLGHEPDVADGAAGPDRRPAASR